MAQINDPFALQVTPELMLKLTKEHRQPRKAAKPKQPPPPSSPPPPIVAPRQPVIRRQMGREVLDQEEGVSQEIPRPFYPGFLSALPGLQQNNDLKKELVPIYKILEESEKLGEKLQKQEEEELGKVKQLAQELQEKQFFAPSQPVPCTNEKEACIQCYRENSKNPLECANTVKLFKECSQRAHQSLLSQVASS
ncbi:hypothetical protein CY35_03G108800 [Sphagnum magellanicum]|nr:hypothetical protein CY35_03G108800 [Sphagnum magellanicum]KAH9568998.1 hypothetical protein CY35_03G108800 [Sphagnum magellanicum]KAH9569002.1 hypothetical protein CY35_03G108800 [Sphagnum magellanicum]